MKLDRNINKDGSGKYALLRIRAVNALRDGDGKLPGDVFSALEVLGQRGLIHWGNESPGERFFVIKYQDNFAAPALLGYYDAICRELCRLNQLVIEASGKLASGGLPERANYEQRFAEHKSLMEYAHDIHAEYLLALAGDRIPD